MTDTSSPLLDVDNAVVSYRSGGRSLRAVDGVSLRVGAGEVVGLVGESGSGKSSLARAICGLQKLSDGMVSLDGDGIRSLLTLRDWLRREGRCLRFAHLSDSLTAELGTPAPGSRPSVSEGTTAASVDRA